MKVIKFIFLCSAVLWLASTPLPSLAAPFQNGSFETYTGTSPVGNYITLSSRSSAITGWTVGGIDYISTYWSASQGNFSLDMDGTDTQGGISQTFATVPGQTYRVTFDLAGNPDGPKGIKTLNVSIDNTLVTPTYTFDTHGNSSTAMGWQTRDFTFTADDGSTTLKFASGTPGSYGAALDNVTVSAIPLPGAVLLLGAGLIRLFTYGRRKLHTIN